MKFFKKLNIIVVIAILTLGIIVGIVLYSTMKERYYENKYPEFYDIEEYILSKHDENEICDAIQYNDDGSINSFGQRYGVEDGYENTFYIVIGYMKIETPSYSITYSWRSAIDERWFGLGTRKLILIFDVYDKTKQGEAEYSLEYDFDSHEYIDTYRHDESGVFMDTEFDERGHEVYNLILDDFTSKIKQCESE